MSRAIQIDFLLAGLRDSSGNSLAGGKIYTYEAGTSTLKSLYSAADMSTMHANPLVLDSRGVAEAWGLGAFKFVIKNSAEVTQYTWDNKTYQQPEDSSIWAGTSTGSSNAYAVTPSPALTALADGDIVTFIANHATSAAATLNVSGLGALAFVRADGTTALTTGDITSGQIVDARYVSSSNHFRLVSQSGVLAVSSGGTGGATAAAARTNLGLSSMATQASSSVSITGGAIVGILDIAVADGGTGASNASDARSNLGLGTMATQAANAVAIAGGDATLTNLAATTAFITGSTITDAVISNTLTMSAAPTYLAGFSYTVKRTLDPSVATVADVANAWNTLVRDLATLKILDE